MEEALAGGEGIWDITCPHQPSSSLQAIVVQAREKKLRYPPKSVALVRFRSLTTNSIPSKA